MARASMLGKAAAAGCSPTPPATLGDHLVTTAVLSWSFGVLAMPGYSRLHHQRSPAIALRFDGAMRGAGSRSCWAAESGLRSKHEVCWPSGRHRLIVSAHIAGSVARRPAKPGQLDS